MNDLPPCPNRLVRKNAYGRTQLFLPTKGTIFREVKCMGGVVKQNDANIYHVLPKLYSTPNVVCWHCCETVEKPSQCVPIPQFYDSAENVFYVFGATCSPSCAKAYIIEHRTFDLGQGLNVLTKMLRDAYGVNHAVVETPPRPALTRFGGPFDPKTVSKNECRLVEPPFVSYCMLVEERGADVAPDIPKFEAVNVEDADTFDEPQAPALFEEYMKNQGEHRCGPGDASAEVLPAKRRREAKSQPGSSSSQPVGPMAKFVKASK